MNTRHACGPAALRPAARNASYRAHHVRRGKLSVPEQSRALTGWGTKRRDGTFRSEAGDSQNDRNNCTVHCGATHPMSLRQNHADDIPSTVPTVKPYATNKADRMFHFVICRVPNIYPRCTLAG